jgi:hypothetical protein
MTEASEKFNARAGKISITSTLKKMQNNITKETNNNNIHKYSHIYKKTSNTNTNYKTKT